MKSVFDRAIRSHGSTSPVQKKRVNKLAGGPRSRPTSRNSSRPGTPRQLDTENQQKLEDALIRVQIAYGHLPETADPDYAEPTSPEKITIKGTSFRDYVDSILEEKISIVKPSSPVLFDAEDKPLPEKS